VAKEAVAIQAGDEEMTEDSNAEADPDTDIDPGTSSENTGGPSQQATARWYFIEHVHLCLLDLYIFADAYETRRLRNDVITAIYSLNSDSSAWMGL
jgi:hypothetical protein